ncbi:hypothetical protein SDC9_208867 [bioreactor metagenome]|uniref:Uncharacterized protein n=1 Tax=bioreactor metagenome TaxID=1076179 RepID=A0A645JNF2_9ZZZZ
MYIQHRKNVVLYFFFQALQVRVTVQALRVGQFHPDFQPVHIIFVENDDLVMRADLLHTHQHGFDLGGEHVHPADDQHIVRPAHHLPHACAGTAASAGAFHQHGDVLGTVAQHGQGLLGQAGDYQLPGLADGQHFPGVRVDDFGNKMVVRNMHPVFHIAFARIPGPDHLG